MENIYRRLRLKIEDPSPYIKACGPLTNTCVLDSLLAAFDIAYCGYPNIADLLHRNDFFRKVISLLKEKEYNEAQKLCVCELNHGKEDLYGNVIDYLPLISKLVQPEEQKPPNHPDNLEEQKPPNHPDNPEEQNPPNHPDNLEEQNPPNHPDNPEEQNPTNQIISILKKYGDVIVLGDPSDPTIILVHNGVQGLPRAELPHYFHDKEKWVFALIFLLIGKDEHMTMCFQSSENIWHLYDNDPQQPSFQLFDLDSLKNYIICLAGYVNITQAEEYKLGIAETGEGVGLSSEQNDPSEHFYTQQSAVDVEMEDLSLTYSIPISETGEGVGPKPFYQPDIDPKFSYQNQPVEDVEMLSCSSSDSD